MAFESFLNPVLGWMLVLPVLWAVLLISFLVSLLVVLIYKFTTDQSLMKDLKEELKAFQKQIKELKDEPQKAMAVQKRAMETNMKYMMHSMKSTLFTFIPIILIFGWLNGNLAFDSINPGETFNFELEFEEGATGEVEIVVPEQFEVIGEAVKAVEPVVAYSVKGHAEGEYLIDFRVGDGTYSKDVLISSTVGYADPEERIREQGLESIRIAYEKRIVLNLFGWKLGWLGSYILFSIAFSLLLRKFMKVY